MAEITAEMVKRLREETNAGVLDCKKALTEHDGDFEKAADYLQKKGLAKAASKATREANEGIVGVYLHSNAKLAAMVKLNCETDFVARNETFQDLAHEIAMHAAAAAPLYVSREEIPAADLEAKTATFREESIATGKPAAVVEKIISGKLDKWFVEVCLLEQPFIRDPETTIKQLISEAIAKLGENIKVGGFSRLVIGD